ncbi:MAG: outer membrane beta-barrel protein [Phaeodactylibacter sp.]|nr:outer membrane beta-barrel protein [Phaeodactylibacter sp.]
MQTSLGNPIADGSRRLVVLFFALALATGLFAQYPPTGAPGASGGRPQMNIGHFYGKIVDENGKGIAYATVQLLGMRFDTASRKPQETLLAGQITEENGDFSLESLPIMGEFTLKASFLGYAELSQKVSFGVPGPGTGNQQGQGRPNGGMAAMAGKFDVDLGNIMLSTAAQTLETVNVVAEGSAAVLTLDRRVFRVDKNATAVGGTAEDALRNVPSLSVDLDGNLTLRNTAPQLFVDGRPTTLSLDQISADAIESVEVITNPSAKFDASGGQAGIVNIVLKKERRIGYNGNVRAGVDTRGGLNAGGDINAREGKLNAFASVNFNQRRSRGESETGRQNLFGNPPTNQLQASDNKMQGFFGMARGGLDWFVDNRNTLTFSGSLVRGQFKPEEAIHIYTDSLFAGAPTSSEALRNSNSERNFRNLGGSVLFKHLFPKQGKEWTADLNYNSITNDNKGYYNTTFIGSSFESRERQLGDGGTNFLIAQTDYVDPINDKMKIETGARAAIRSFDNNNTNAYYDFDTDTWIALPSFADQYQFDDAVYAAYLSFSHQLPKWGYQVGLRAESSTYTGKLPESGATFDNDYPISLFPSVFISRKLNEEDNIQLSYTRRINRPNFFQLMPFTDFSDSLNLRRGNPDLLPEFTNSFEMSYQNFFSKSHNLLVTAYYKQAEGLITTYQFTETDPQTGREYVVSSFNNSNSGLAYGVEFILKNTFWEKVELTSNLNLYNSRVDASNIEAGLVDERFSWFLKENLSVKLPADFTFQVNGEYRSRAAYSPSSGEGRFRHWGPTNTAQGYTIENWHVDAALRKDLFNRRASIVLSVQDIFRSRRSGSYSSSDYFIQESWRIRDPQVARLNFSYRFGKMDTSLFKRKNTNMNTEGMDLMQ